MTIIHTETDSNDVLHEIKGNMTFVQIDLETLGLKSNSPVVSIGAVAYTRGIGIFSEFEAFFDLDEQFALGRLPDASTIYWWMGQSAEARAEFSVNRVREKVSTIQNQFYAWYTEVFRGPLVVGDEVYAMANGNDFDLAMLDDLFAVVPWHYKKKMCWRTIANLYRGEIEYPEQTTRHSALADARSQALAHLKLIAKYPERLSWIK